MQDPRKTKPKLYYIEWEDPISVHNGWFELNQEELNKLMPARCKSVGWIIKRSDKYITICANMIDKDNEGSGDTTIPKSLILFKKEIKL